MAEVFRIPAGEARRHGGGPSAQNGRDGRDVLYDYAEAEALWNEADTTAPGPGGELPRAAFQSPAGDGDDDGDGAVTTVQLVAAVPMVERSPGNSLMRSRLLLAAAGILVAGVSYWWGAASRSPVDPWPPLSAAGSVNPSLPSPSSSRANPAPTALPVVMPLPPPVPEAAPVPAPVAVTAAPLAAGAESSDGGRRRRNFDRRRWHRAPPVADAPAAELPEATEPAPRGRRSRLRPIDVTDPFAR